MGSKSFLEKTGFCWACGRVCKGLFCNDVCEKRYDRIKRHRSKKLFGSSL